LVSKPVQKYNYFQTDHHFNGVYSGLWIKFAERIKSV
jgi:hypothetical protein